MRYNLGKTMRDKDGTIKSVRNYGFKIGNSGADLHVDDKNGIEFSGKLGNIASFDGGYSKKKKKGRVSAQLGKRYISRDF